MHIPQSSATVSRREREILDIVYSLGRATAAEVREELSRPPSYSAVRTTLGRLVAKGHLRVTRDAIRHVYSPTGSRVAASKQALRRVLDTFFGGSLAEAVNTLVEDRARRLSSEEVRQIQRALKASQDSGN